MFSASKTVQYLILGLSILALSPGGAPAFAKEHGGKEHGGKEHGGKEHRGKHFGWKKGKKKGWEGAAQPPAQAKKEAREAKEA